MLDYTRGGQLVGCDWLRNFKKLQSTATDTCGQKWSKKRMS